jgi:DNA-binding transcriptional ArsR family regulator
VNSHHLDRAFAACSHPIRRTILERLAQGELSVGEATGDLAVTKPAITKHLKVLEEAGAIVRVVDGRRHRLALAPAPLREARSWIAAQERLWQRKFDVVEQYLQEQEQEHPPTAPREEPS